MNRPRRITIKCSEDVSPVVAIERAATVARMSNENKDWQSTTRGVKHPCAITTFGDNIVVFCSSSRAGSWQFNVSKGAKR